MSELFISYARKDQGFVRDLNAALQKKNRAAWIDWRSIPDSAQWRAEILAAIEAVDNFLFIISPDSLGSPMCGQELAYALANGKRIVTILYHPVDRKDLLPGLEEIQWINYPELGFEGTFERLIAAIDTDLEWVRQHTRLLTKATEWKNNHRDESFLLRGYSTGSICSRISKPALTQTPRNTRPVPPQLHGSKSTATLRSHGSSSHAAGTMKAFFLARCSIEGGGSFMSGLLGSDWKLGC